MDINNFLQKTGLKYEDLSMAERQTLNRWLGTLQQKQLNIPDVQEYIKSMVESVCAELAQEPEYIRVFIFKVENPKNQLLKARIRNYLLLDAFLSSPDKAKKAIEQSLAMVNKT